MTTPSARLGLDPPTTLARQRALRHVWHTHVTHQCHARQTNVHCNHASPLTQAILSVLIVKLWYRKPAILAGMG